MQHFLIKSVHKALENNTLGRCRARVLVATIACLITCIYTLHAQLPQADSLLALLHKSPTQSQRNTLLPQLLQYYHSIQRDTLYEYAGEAYHRLRPLVDAEEKGKIAQAFAHAYMQWGWIDSAAYFLAEALRDSAHISQDLYWALQRNQAVVYGSNYRTNIALDLLIRITAAAAEAGDWASYAASANTIGSIYLGNKQYKDAKRWIRMAQDKVPAINTPRALATQTAVYTNLAGLHIAMGSYKEAKQALAQAESHLNRSPNLSVEIFLNRHKAKLLMAEGNVTDAEVALRRIQSLQNALGIGGLYIDDNLFFAEFYKETGYYDKAIETCLRNLKEGNVYEATVDSPGVLNSNLRTRLPYYEMLAELYKLTGQQELYTTTLENILEARENLYQTNRAEELANLQAQYELSEKERLLVIQKIDLLKKDFWLWSLGAAATLLLGAGLYRFARYRSQKQAQLERVLQKAEAEKAALMQAERQRIANDLHDNLGAYGAAIRHNLLQLQHKQDRSQHYTQELDNNVRHMVDELGNTIWVLHHAEKNLTDIYDKLKAWSSKILKSYPQIKCRFAEEGEGNIALSPVQSLQWLYIMQEVLNNALKHAEATQINVQLRQDTQSWEVQVQDNGKGLPEAIVEGNGLESIRNRCAKLGWLCSWSSVPQGGTLFLLKTQT